MFFLSKCILYKQDEDIVVHERYRIKNAFRFAIEDIDYAKTIIDILIKYASYSRQDFNNDIYHIIDFVKLIRKELSTEDYELYIECKEYLKEVL